MIEMLQRVKSEVLGKQFDLMGTKNAWIVKPGGKSRGRGIRVFSRFKAITESCYGSGSTCWVLQKYIENPMIILGRKFDIRQWVVVTSWNPLKIFMYDECYVRFSPKEYDDSKLHDVHSHLTNN